MPEIAAPELPARRKAQFLICDSCFWCASVFGDGAAPGRCPCCKSMALESIPIAAGGPRRPGRGMSGAAPGFAAAG